MADSLAAAVRAVRQGRPVLYPTDTLWGIGVRPDDPRAVRRLYELKERPGGMPVSVAFSSYEEVEPYADLRPSARATIRRWLPGPFTFLVPASARARREWAPSILGEGGTVGVRIPDHPLARSLLAHTGPLTSTSANRHGEPPCPDAAAARRQFGARVGAYLSGPPAPTGRPSALVGLTGARPTVVRRG